MATLQSALVSAPTRERSWFGLVLLLAGVSFLGAILAYAYNGTFMRFIADDYCNVSVAVERGLWGSQAFLYEKWTGIYSHSFVLSLFGPMGPGMPSIIGPATIIIWLACAIFAIEQLTRGAGLSSSLSKSMALALIFEFLILHSIPNPVQSVYWLTSMFGYTVPLVLVTFYIGWVARQSRLRASVDWMSLLVSGVCTFLIGGFSETYVVVQTAAFGLAVVPTFFPVPMSIKRNVRPLLLAGLLGSLFALLVTLLSPGNAARAAWYPPRADVITATSSSIVNAWRFLTDAWARTPIDLLLALGAPALVVIGLGSVGSVTIIKRRTLLALLVLLPIVGAILIVASFAPSAYAESAYPPDRALTIPTFVLVSILMAWGAVAGLGLACVAQRSLRSRLAFTLSATLVLILAGAYAVQVAVATFADAPKFQDYAARWDVRDRAIRQAVQGGARNLVLLNLGFNSGLADISYQSDNWLNQCAAAYYGLESVVVKDKLP